MKNNYFPLILLFIAMTLFAVKATSQNFTPSIGTDGKIHVVDSDPIYTHAWLPIQRTEFLFQGDCWMQKTGRLPLQGSYTFDLPEELDGGFAVQKIKWYGILFAPGDTSWNCNPSTCYRIAMPPPPPPSAPQTLSVIVPSGTQEPDWYDVSYVAGQVVVEPNVNCPGGVKIDAQIITSVSGVIQQSGNLPPGWHNITLVLSWQGMFFLQQKAFIV